MKRVWMVLILGFALSLGGLAYGAVSDFEDLTLGSESYWNGSSGSGGFQSGKAWFFNRYEKFVYLGQEYESWEVFSYSNKNDIYTTGLAGQYTAMGVNRSNAYGVGYQGWYGPVQVHFSDAVRVLGAQFTNTAYAYWSMVDGDFFARRFGYGKFNNLNPNDWDNPAGSDPDWFKIEIYGLNPDHTRSAATPVPFFLADFKFDSNYSDYIVSSWTWLDLSSLGDVYGLEFALSSSDNEPYGFMNTPGYFAIDNLVTDDLTPAPVPGAVWLLGSGILGLLALRRPRLG